MHNPVNTRRSGSPRTAALLVASEVRTKLRAGQTSGEPWQHRVMEYDREGPGVLGYYLDIVGLLASLCPLIVEERERDGSWVPSKDPVLAVALSGYRSELSSQGELVAAQVRHREGVGECWIVYSDEIGWCVTSIPNVTVVRGSNAVDFTDPYGVRRRVPDGRAWRSWIMDPYEPHRTTSPIRRVLPELRRLRAATRNQTRLAESVLAMNGLLAFEPGADGAGRVLGPEAGGAQARSKVAQIIDDYVTLAQESFEDDDAPSAAVPYPYEGPAAKYIELGRQIDAGSIQVEDKALEAFARGVNFPAQLLINGPGSANHWNEWVLQDVQHRTGLAPKITPVCDDISAVYLRPMVRILNGQVGSWNKDPRRVRVGFDMSYLTQKPDLTATLMEAWRSGIASREEVADALGIKELLQVPVGLSEYEHWELASGSKGAPYAEVDPRGRLIVPAAVQPEAPAELGTGEGEPPPEGDPAHEAPAPPPQLAALGVGNTSAVRRLPETLGAIDQRLEAQLSGVANLARAAAAAEVAKQVGANDELTAEQLWMSVDPEVRSKVDVKGIVSTVIKRYGGDVEAAYDEAVAAIEAAYDDADLTIPEFAVRVGVAVFVLYLISEVADFFGALATAPIDAATKLSARSLRPSTTAVRASMSAAAGARVDVAGRLVPSQSGMPTTTDGTPWQGTTGLALGHNSAVNMKRQPGWSLTYVWRHGFFGQPRRPFPPHLALDGSEFSDPANVPGGLYPGDHPWCRCGLTWRIERTS